MIRVQKVSLGSKALCGRLFVEQMIQGVLTGYELYTDIDLDTAVLPYRGILHVTFVKKSYRKGKLLSFCLALSGVRFIFLVMGMFFKMTCGRC